MSLRAMLAVLEESRSELAARLVLIALADYAHDDGTNAYPSVETIARKARVHPTTVHRSLRWLEQAGEIRRGDRPTSRGVTVWQITLGGLANCHPKVNNGSSSGSGSKLLDLEKQDARPPLQDATPLERWLAWSKANAEITNEEILDYRLDELHIPVADRPALIAAHLKQRRPR